MPMQKKLPRHVEKTAYRGSFALILPLFSGVLGEASFLLQR